MSSFSGACLQVTVGQMIKKAKTKQTLYHQKFESVLNASHYNLNGCSQKQPMTFPPGVGTYWPYTPGYVICALV